MLKRLQQPEEAPPWSLLTALAAPVAAFFAIIIGTTIMQVVFGFSGLTLLAGYALGGTLMVLYVYSLSQRAPANRTALRLQPIRTPLPLLLLLSMGVAILFDLISLGVTGQFVSLPELTPLVELSAQPLAWVLALVLMLVAQPLGEELIFRGVMQPALRSAFGPLPGLLASGLSYGLLHLLAYSSGETDAVTVWYALVLPALDGIYFAGVRAYTGSTRAAIFAHAAFGLFAVLKVFIIAG